MERAEKQFTKLFENPFKALWERLLDLSWGNFSRARWQTKALVLGGGTALLIAAA